MWDWILFKALNCLLEQFRMVWADQVSILVKNNKLHKDFSIGDYSHLHLVSSDTIGFDVGRCCLCGDRP